MPLRGRTAGRRAAPCRGGTRQLCRRCRRHAARCRCCCALLQQERPRSENAIAQQREHVRGSNEVQWARQRARAARGSIPVGIRPRRRPRDPPERRQMPLQWRRQLRRNWRREPRLPRRPAARQPTLDSAYPGTLFSSSCTAGTSGSQDLLVVGLPSSSAAVEAVPQVHHHRRLSHLQQRARVAQGRGGSGVGAGTEFVVLHPLDGGARSPAGPPPSAALSSRGGCSSLIVERVQNYKLGACTDS